MRLRIDMEESAVVDATLDCYRRLRESGRDNVGVVLQEGFDARPELARELQDHVKTITAPYKHPRRVDFVDALPRTSSGKLRRRAIR